MSDLIERLRLFEASGPAIPSCQLFGEAADEIERLAGELQHCRAVAAERQEGIERLRVALAKSCEEGRDEMYDCGYNRLRDALERIRQYEDGGALAFIQIQRIVDEALKDD